MSYLSYWLLATNGESCILYTCRAANIFAHWPVFGRFYANVNDKLACILLKYQFACLPGNFHKNISSLYFFKLQHSCRKNSISGNKKISISMQCMMLSWHYQLRYTISKKYDFWKLAAVSIFELYIFSGMQSSFIRIERPNILLQLKTLR